MLPRAERVRFTGLEDLDGLAYNGFPSLCPRLYIQ